jgi:hypothetical protein
VFWINHVRVAADEGILGFGAWNAFISTTAPQEVFAAMTSPHVEKPGVVGSDFRPVLGSAKGAKHLFILEKLFGLCVVIDQFFGRRADFVVGISQ